MNERPTRGHRGDALRGLYAITNGPRDDLLGACEAALAGGAALLQYRDKSTDAARRLDEARALSTLCRRHDVALIINDDIELALAVQAAGVHLGADDADLRHARKILGADAILGASCYDSFERAKIAAEAGADYLAFGAFFPSPTKPNTRHAEIDILRRAAELGLPRVAIGGITTDNAASLIAAGADCLAVISALFGANDVRAAARRFSTLFESAPGPSSE